MFFQHKNFRTNVFILIVMFLFISSQLSLANNQTPAKDEIALQGVDGSTTILKAAADDDGDGIDNQLEVNGYVYSILNGLEAWNGDTTVTYYKTDPLRWSTDGDPYSDYMEVTGINMPAAISAPENHPLVAARPIITIKMQDYDVIPLEEISDSKGGDQSSSFTNEVSNSNEVSASVTVEAELNPFKLVGGSATASYSHTWTTTNSSTSSFGSNWNNTRTINPDEAARLKLRIYMVNEGGATALDVSPTINLKLGTKTISTFVPSQVANILTPPGTSDNRFPKNGTIVVEEDENANFIIITLDELKAIQMGTPLSLEVVQVDAKVVRWNSDDQDWNSDIEWASFESEINPVSVEILAELGSGENYRYEVFAGTPYWDPQYKLDDLVSLVFDKADINGTTYIENRRFPEDWYFSSPSQAVIDEWNSAGQPSNILSLRMHRNSRLVMMSPGSNPKPSIILATYSADYKNVKISARPNNFPILSVKADITVNGETETYDLVKGSDSFYSLETDLTDITDGPGTVTVTNARGDVSTASIILPAIYANAQDVKKYSSFLPEPGGEFWIYQNGDEDKAMLLYCLFYDLETDAELQTPLEYLSLTNNDANRSFSDINAYSDQYRATYNKIRINPKTLKVGIKDITFSEYENLAGGTVPEYLIDGDYYGSLGTISWAYPEIDSALAQVDLANTPFYFAVDNPTTHSTDETLVYNKSRKKMELKRMNLSTISYSYYGYGGIDTDSLQLSLSYTAVSIGQGLMNEGNAMGFNQSARDGEVNMWESDALKLTDSFTLEAWIFPTGPGLRSVWGGTIMSREGEYELMRMEDGTIRWTINTDNLNWYTKTTGYYAQEQQWLHIAIVYDNQTIKSYFNGELFNEIAANGTLNDYKPTLNHFKVGGRHSDTDHNFQGYIDEVRVWNVARSESQIKHTFMDTLDSDYYSTADSGLVGYWRFDSAEDRGEGVLETPDLSVSENYGTLYGDSQISTGLPTDINENIRIIPSAFVLEQNYPNPFNPATVIKYQLPEAAEIELAVFNIYGQKIQTLAKGFQSNGSHSLRWNGRNQSGNQVASGTYIYRLVANGKIFKSHKMLLLR